MFSYTNITKANEVNVSTFQELKDAIASNNTAKVIANIEVTETLDLSSYTSKIYSDNQATELTLGTGLDAMFVSKGGNFEINTITLNGNQNGRILDVSGSTVAIKNSIVKNATTENFNPVIEADGFNHQRYQGGAIYADSSTLNIEETTFVDNHTKNNTPAQVVGGEAVSPHGGAIYIGSQTKLNIVGGEFRNNYSGSGSPHGEGGAIKAEGGSHININVTGTSRTVFDGNHNHHTESSVGGLQGGAIEITRSTADINNTDFIVKGGFDTGGAIKFEAAGSQDKHNIVRNSTFKLVGGNLPQTPVASTYFGTSGGAIVSQDSFLTVDNSDFTMENNPNVSFAGGHIDIVGVGEFNLLNSRLKGNAPDWMAWNEVWKYKSAKYGGAIAFENGASAKALIKDTEIKNYMVDHTGGVIAVGHRKGNEYGNTTVDLTIEGSTIHNGQAYTYDNNSAGGGVYITEGSKVVIKNSEKNVTTISQMLANYGAAIYNKGELTIDGGTKVINNRAEQMAGGLFNDGYANVNDATFSGNWKQSKWGPHEIHTIGTGDPAVYEKSGENIYAKQDVIVGTKANFDGKDIRVIDKQSSVVLSGPRETVINVSISETEKTGANTIWEKDFFENVHKYVGYTVGRGLVDADLTATYKPVDVKAYVPTPEDAKKFHFVSRTTPLAEIADLDDHDITAKWDYVFNPEAKTVVLGQRAKMVYHTNESTATIEGGEVDNAPTGQKLEQLYTFYMSGNGMPKVSINNEVAKELTEIDKIPTLADYTFKSWNKEVAKEKPKYDVDKVEDEYDFKNATFTKTWHKPDNTAEIRSILSVEKENTLHTYAIYDKLLVVKAKKIWKAENKEEVTLQLVRTDKNNEVIEEKIVGADVADWISFKGVSKVENGVDITSKYAVIEKGVAEGKIYLNNKKYSVEYFDVTAIESLANPTEKDVKYFTVKNTELIDIPVSKIWGEPKNMTFIFTSIIPSVFNEVENISIMAEPDDEGPIAESVSVELYRNGKKIRNALVLNIDNLWRDVFRDVPVTDEDGNVIVSEYTVKEVGEENGKVTLDGNRYSVEITGDAKAGFTITNKYLPPQLPLTPAKTKVQVTKTWADETNKAEMVTVELYKNGVATGTTAELKADNNWTYTFENLPVVENIKDKTKNVYTVKEVGEENGRITIGEKVFEVSITGDAKAGFVITNKYLPPQLPLTPAKTKVQVTKTWTDEANKAEMVTVELYKNGVATGTTAELKADNNWTYTFENLPVVENIKDKTKNVYTVKEVGEENGRITINGKIFEVSITGDAKAGFVITNKYLPPQLPLTPAKTKVQVTKTWTDEANKAEMVTVELYKNGVATGTTAELKADNNWTYTFENLPVVENIKDKTKNVYTVKEVGEENGRITIDGKLYEVSITGDAKAGFVITNKYLPPQLPLTPAKTKVQVTKTWTDEANKAEMVTVELYKNGVATGTTAELKADNNWTYTFENLPVVENIKDKTKNVYTVKEVGEKDGRITIGEKVFEVTIEGTAKGGFVIRNKYLPPQLPLTPAKTKVQVTKTWTDEANKAEMVTVELYKNGVATGTTAELKADNNWTYTFENLPVVENIKDKTKNVYTVKEVGEENGRITIDGKLYEVSITGDAKAGFVITNKYLPPQMPLTPATKTVKVTKEWVGNIKEKSIEVVLYANGEKTDKVITLSEENNWTGMFEGLKAVDNISDKKAIEYTVKEVGEENNNLELNGNKYTVEYSGNAKDGFVIKNTEVPPAPPTPSTPKGFAKTGVATTSMLTVITSFVGVVVLKKFKKED